MGGRRQKSLGEDSDEQLPSAPGFRGAAVLMVEVQQGAGREAGTAGVFMQGCTNLTPSPVRDLLNLLFTCHTHCYPRIVSSS